MACCPHSEQKWKSCRLLVCETCSQIFDSFTRKPRILDCSHTFCEVCLENIQAFDTIKCPSCCQLSTVTGKAELDRVRLTFVGLIRSTQSPSRQDNCCCYQHSTDIELFCRDCIAPLCHLCVTGHQRHNVVNLDSLLNFMKKLVLSLCKQMESMLPTVEAKLKACEVGLLRLQSNLQQAERNFLAATDKTSLATDDRPTEALDRLRATAEADCSVLERQRDLFECLLQEIQCEVKHGRGAVAFGLLTGIMKTMSRLQKVVVEINVKVTSLVLQVPADQFMEVWLPNISESFNCKECGPTRPPNDSSNAVLSVFHDQFDATWSFSKNLPTNHCFTTVNVWMDEV